MSHWFTNLGTGIDRSEAWAIGIGVAAIPVVLALRWTVRALRNTAKDRVITVLVNVSALMATGVQASGMWKFFRDTMQLSFAYRLFLFPFLEVALLAFGLRARENVDEGGDAGFDGLMVWVLAISSGLMASTDASTGREALMRIMVAVVVAMLWTRDLMAAKQRARRDHARPLERVRWRLNLSAVAVKLGLADAGDHGIAAQDANRRMDRYVRAAHTAQRLSGQSGWTARRAMARKTRAHDKLMRHARLHADPTALMEELGRSAVEEALQLLGIPRTAAVAASASSNPVAEAGQHPAGQLTSEDVPEASEPTQAPTPRAVLPAQRTHPNGVPHPVEALSVAIADEPASTRERATPPPEPETDAALMTLKHKLFMVLDDIHASGDARVGNARERNRIAREVAMDLGGSRSADTIRKYASEWAQARNLEPDAGAARR